MGILIKLIFIFTFIEVEISFSQNLQNSDCLSELKSSTELNCSLKLKNNISKRLIIRGAKSSGITLDCQGNTIENSLRIEPEILMKNEKLIISSPENITIKNCKIKLGARVRISDSKSDLSYPILESSRLENHIELIQKAAPKKITFDNVEITNGTSVALYIEPGVTNFTLKNSKIFGTTNDVAIYLGIEGKGHIIENNEFYINALDREIIAIDGVSHSVIQNNIFHQVKHGGVFIYRNCGEKGIIRHQKPTNNIVAQNKFILAENHTAPAIWNGSRNRTKDNISFCWQDKNLRAGGFTQKRVEELMHLSFKNLTEAEQNQILKSPSFKIGSSEDNSDFATDNIIQNNIVIKSSKTQNKTPSILVIDQESNIVKNNTITTDSLTQKSCFISNIFPNQNLKHGESSFHDNFNNNIKCSSQVKTCYDGTVEIYNKSCQPKNLRASCETIENNTQCSTQFKCPLNQRIVSLKGICRVGSRAVSIELQNNQIQNKIGLIGESFDKNNYCEINNEVIKSSQQSLYQYIGHDKINIGCHASDKNNKACTIKLQMTCE